MASERISTELEAEAAACAAASAFQEESCVSGEVGEDSANGEIGANVAHDVSGNNGESDASGSSGESGASGSSGDASSASGVNSENDDSDRLRMPPFRDTNFYQKRKHGKYRQVAAPILESRVADTHAHIHMFDDPSFELARCAANGVEFVCAVTDPSEDTDVLFRELDGWIDGARGEIAKLGVDAGVPHVRIAAGVHPHNARLYDGAMERSLYELLSDSRVSAVGEIGLDYHYDLSPREDQRRVFARQLHIANEVGLPVSLHIREAHDEALSILMREGFPSNGTVLHCCGLSIEELKPWIDEGCYIAYGGPITFKKADDVRDAAKSVPWDRVLTETDSPYMTPEPMRGVACTPAHVIFTADALCGVEGCSTPDERRNFLEQLMENARSIFDRVPSEWQLANAKQRVWQLANAKQR